MYSICLTPILLPPMLISDDLVYPVLRLWPRANTAASNAVFPCQAHETAQNRIGGSLAPTCTKIFPEELQTPLLHNHPPAGRIDSMFSVRSLVLRVEFNSGPGAS